MSVPVSRNGVGEPLVRLEAGGSGAAGSLSSSADLGEGGKGARPLVKIFSPYFKSTFVFPLK
jgi:hypothetical protein